MLKRSVTVLLAMASAFAHAATVKDVNSNHDRVILQLDALELRGIEAEQLLLFIHNGRGTAVVVDRVNEVRSTCVVLLEEQGPEINVGDTVELASPWWDSPHERSFVEFSQAHHWAEKRVDGAVRFHRSNADIKRGDEEETRAGSTAQFRFDSYLWADEHWGAGLVFEQLSDRTEGDQLVSTSLVRAGPQVWIETEPRWRLSLSLTPTLLSLTDDSDSSSSLDFTLFRGAIGFLYLEPDWEWGGRYQVATKDTQNLKDGDGEVIGEVTIKEPATALIFFRWLNAAHTIWGSQFGYSFFERELSPAVELRRRPQPAELVKLALSAQHRSSDLSSWDAYIEYQGAKWPQDLPTALEANRILVGCHHRRRMDDQWAWGAGLEVTSGQLEATEQGSAVEHRVIAYSLRLTLGTTVDKESLNY